MDNLRLGLQADIGDKTSQSNYLNYQMENLNFQLSTYVEIEGRQLEFEDLIDADIEASVTLSIQENASVTVGGVGNISNGTLGLSVSSEYELGSVLFGIKYGSNLSGTDFPEGLYDLSIST